MTRLIMLLTLVFMLTGANCHKDDLPPEVDAIKIEGFIITDNLGNQVAVVGTADNDWKIQDWSQFSAAEKAYLDFTDNIDMSNTTVCSINQPTAYPNPFGNVSQINFVAADSVKVKMAVVNSRGQVLRTLAIKIKGNKAISLDYSDVNLYPAGLSLRYYFSYSASAQANFKAGYGDVKICRLTGVPYTACF